MPATSNDDLRRKALEKQVGKWVSQTFFGTLFKQMRNSPFKSEILSGGRGGEVFGSMLDQQLADNMSRGAGKKLVNAIIRQIEGAQAYKSQSNPRRVSSDATATRA